MAIGTEPPTIEWKKGRKVSYDLPAPFPFDADLREATVITMYLLPALNLKLLVPREVCAAAEEAQLPHPADAALFNYAHDITRSPRAVANLMRQLARSDNQWQKYLFY